MKLTALFENPEAMTSVLVRNVRIFDGWSVLYPAGSVILRDGVILSVTKDVPKVLPEHTEVIFGDGKTILPGLIDAHVHAGSDPEDLMQPLRFGVTTVLDMHNEPEAVANLTKATRSSSSLADFRSACHAATIEGGWPAPVYEMNRSTVSWTIHSGFCRYIVYFYSH
jgi:imidazolonepropionase-like amidohydrolase